MPPILLGDGSPGHDPPRWLPRDLRDEVVVGVVVQHRHTFSLGHGGDQQVREADCPDLSAAPQGTLDIEGPPPVFIVGGEPFVTGVAVGP
jgi:hypothetical protein